MHEMALADAVVSTALDAARREGMARIERVEVHVGELQHIKKDVFEYALKEVLPAAEPLLEGTRIDLEIIPARFRCRACGHEFGRGDVKEELDGDQQEAVHFIPELARSFMGCPSCGSPDFEVTAGRGVSIQSIEGFDA